MKIPFSFEKSMKAHTRLSESSLLGNVGNRQLASHSPVLSSMTLLYSGTWWHRISGLPPHSWQKHPGKGVVSISKSPTLALHQSQTESSFDSIARYSRKVRLSPTKITTLRVELKCWLFAEQSETNAKTIHHYRISSLKCFRVKNKFSEFTSLILSKTFLLSVKSLQSH